MDENSFIVMKGFRKTKFKTPDQAMFDILNNALDRPDNRVEVEYHQQWKTIFKAQDLGYLDEYLEITVAGMAHYSELTFKYGASIIKGELIR